MLTSEEKTQLTKLEHNLKRYQTKLLQATKKNRSVQYKKTYDKHNFNLTTLAQFNQTACDKIFKKAVKGSTSSILLLSNSTTGDDADTVRRKLKTLSYNIKQIEDETGRQVCYLGFPFLYGHANDDFFVRGPLILFPLSLSQNAQVNKGWTLNLSDSKPIINGALLSAIKKNAELDIADGIEETFDTLIDDMTQYDQSDLADGFFKRVTQWLQDILPLETNLNDFELTAIPEMGRPDIEDLEKQKFHLKNHMVIGNFPQADNEIYKDYSKLLDASSLDTGPLGVLFDIYEDTEADDASIPSLDDVADEQINTVLESDSTQDMVILESKQSSMVVVRGPPGTGKSQVITNLMCDALVNSKKVLLVCQKRAALDVVYDRLGTVGLDKFTVLLDKESQDKQKIYKKLCNTIEDNTIYDVGITSIEDVSRQIDDKIKFLTRWQRVLHQPYFGKITIRQLYSMAEPEYTSKIDISDLVPEDYNKLNDYLETFSEIEILFKQFVLDEHTWHGRRSFDTLGIKDKSNIMHTIDYILLYMQSAIITQSKEQQDELVKSLDTYVNDPGWFRLRQKKAAKAIHNILDVDKITVQYVQDKTEPATKGVSFWTELLHLATFFKENHQSEIYDLHKAPDQLKIKLQKLKGGLIDFDSLQSYDAKISENPDILKLLLLCKDKLNPDEAWSDVIRQEVYLYWIHTIESENTILKGDATIQYNKNRDALSALLDEKKDIVAKSIQAKIAGSANIDEIYGRAKIPEKQNWKDFSAELKKKRRVKPVRQLFGKYSKQFLKIAPCWLASPESVSKIFPLQRDLFDLVIIDEASQLAVERVLPVLYRAKHVLVAGDDKQLQPFDMFQVKDEDIPYEEDDNVLEEKSLLDMALVRHHPMQLAWHYRSKYQDLINFSNHAFYDGKLQVAPNVISDPQHPPIRWVQCSGIWQKRQNHQEAQAVLEEIYDTLKNTAPDYQSIGVITFNDEQRDLIHTLYDKKIDEDIDFARHVTAATVNKGRDEQPFFRNIENVQGDERDVIIFSVGYAPDVDGKFVNRFGPLSVAGGENRLNVAVTRARTEMVIVCSINPQDIKDTSKNLGPLRLRQFLEYAKATSQSDKDKVNDVIGEINSEHLVDDDKSLHFDSDFERQVHTALEKRNYTVHTSHGVSGYKIDLVVVHPANPHLYILGIECDGATYHSSPSAKERDVRRQKFLESKGWTLVRVWSRDWWRNPDREIDKVISKITSLCDCTTTIES